MLPVMICAKGKQVRASSGGVTFLRCSCSLSTALRAGKISFTVWAVRKCRPRKASTLLRRMLKGIVKFNQIGKPVHAVSMGHGLADFPQHVADSGSGNTQVLAARRTEMSPLSGRHEVNGPEPFDQGYPGGMKQSSSTYGDLMSAACVLVEPARGNERCFGVAACRTLKTIWPSHFE